MKQLGKIQEWLNNSRPREFTTREMSSKVTDLAAVMFSVSQKSLTSKHRRMRFMLSAIAKNEAVRGFFQLYQEGKNSQDIQSRESLKSYYTQHRKDILSAFGFADSWKLRLASCCFMDELKLLESLLGDGLSSFVMDDDASTLRRQQDSVMKMGASFSAQLLTHAGFGDEGVADYTEQMLRFMSQLGSAASIDLDVMRLVPRVDVYSPEDMVAVFLQRVRPLLTENALRTESHRILFSRVDEDRLALVARACRVLRDGQEFPTLDLGLEVAACLDGCIDVVSELSSWASSATHRKLTLRLCSGEALSQRASQSAYTEHGARLFTTRQELALRLRDIMDQVVASSSLHLDLASQDVFDVAYACALWKKFEREDIPSFTLNAGLGDALAWNLLELGGAVYTHSYHYEKSAQDEGATQRAILIESVYEPSSPLALSPTLQVVDQAWRDLQQRYMLSWNKAVQLHEDQASARPLGYLYHVQSVTSLIKLQSACAHEHEQKREYYDVRIGEKTLESQFSVISRVPFDYSQIDYKVGSMSYEHIDELIAHVKEASRVQDSLADRVAVWKSFSSMLQERKAELIAVLVRDAGYRLADADEEISAAAALCGAFVDEMGQIYWGEGLRMKTGGIAVVNAGEKSPLLDAIEGIASAHLLGYAVIYKAANKTFRLAELLMELLESLEQSTEEGYPSFKGFFLAQCIDNQIAAYLFNHADVESLYCYAPLNILGKECHSERTRYRHEMKHTKHAMYLRADAEWRQALIDLFDAFIQRMVQTSVSPRILIVDAELYGRADFQSALQIVFSSLLPSDISAQSTLLSDEELRAELRLREGESWLVAPKGAVPKSPVYRPVVRLGLREDSPLLHDEFCLQYPQLLVMCAESVEQAVRVQKRVAAGEVASLYSSNADFIHSWKSEMKLSRLFVNTSPCLAFIEARGQATEPRYVDHQYMGDYLPSRARWEAEGAPASKGKNGHVTFKPWELLGSKLSNTEKMHLHTLCDSMAYWWGAVYGAETEFRSHSGVCMYRSYRYASLLLRIPASLSESDTAVLLAAALMVDQELEISLESSRPWVEEYFRQRHVKVTLEDQSQLQERIKNLAASDCQIRFPHADAETRELAEKWLITLRDEPVLAHARMELMRLCRVQWVMQRGNLL